MQITKTEWKEVENGLLHVPQKSRGSAWKKTFDFVRSVVEGRNSLAASLGGLSTSPDGDEIHYDVTCSLCKRFILVGDDYVYKGITGYIVHYDCFHKE